MRAVYRTGALESDLAALCGPSWRTAARTLPEGDAYAQRIAAVAHEPARLAAHAYVRYLGDLNGGQLVGGTVARSLNLDASALAFYAFPAETAALEPAYRSALAAAGRAIGDAPPSLEEAALAFRMNIALSDAVRAAA
jgi:heme oxygenase